MKAMLTGLKRFALAVHRSEKGAEGLEKLLIVAAVVLPLLGLLVVFRDTISDWMSRTWGDVKGDAGEYNTPKLPNN